MDEIIVGVDESAAAKEAATKAAALATRSGRPLHLVMAVPSRSSVGNHGNGSKHWQLDSIGRAEQTLVALAGAVRCSTAVTHAVVVDRPARALCAEAVRLDASMIAIGNARVRGAVRALGSVAKGVAIHAPCDILIVHST